ncbi:MAG: F0F1 ATP synthase subunit B [Lachnospiraceae bacterium]|nr:F0F1 ATP synthase subunit B [Lachnospiraceae bacterium]
MERLFDLDFQLLHDAVLTLISVIVLFFIMSNFLFNPVREFLEKRKNKIAEDLSYASSQKEEAVALKEEYDQRLSAVDKEAEEILKDARKRALATENRIVAEAKEEAARIMQRANEEAVLAKQKVADDVKKEMVSLASAMAGKVVAANIDTTVQDSLIDETLKEIGESTWLS